jgi:hypothetical protein
MLCIETHTVCAAMGDLRTVQTTYLDPEEPLFQDGKIPEDFGPHGKCSDGLLRICRYELHHRAITPQDLANKWHGRLRDKHGQILGSMTSDLVKVIVGQNRSHFAYVKVVQIQDDNSEMEVECVSVTMKTGHGRHRHGGYHPVYTRDGQPMDPQTRALLRPEQVDRRRPTFSEGQEMFPTMPVPQCLPPLPNEVMLLDIEQPNTDRVIACTNAHLQKLENVSMLTGVAVSTAGPCDTLKPICSFCNPPLHASQR